MFKHGDLGAVSAELDIFDRHRSTGAVDESIDTDMAARRRRTAPFARFGKTSCKTTCFLS
jgi:hypothetical protein